MFAYGREPSTRAATAVRAAYGSAQPLRKDTFRQHATYRYGYAKGKYLSREAIQARPAASFLLLAHRVSGAKICPKFLFARVPCPVGRGSVPKEILDIQSGSVFDKEPDDLVMARPGSLVQRCRM